MEKITFKVLIGATGSVASMKIPNLVECILKLNTVEANLKFEVIAILDYFYRRRSLFSRLNIVLFLDTCYVNRTCKTFLQAYRDTARSAGV